MSVECLFSMTLPHGFDGVAIASRSRSCDLQAEAARLTELLAGAATVKAYKCDLADADAVRGMLGRGLHSSTPQLNLSRFWSLNR